MNFGFKKYIVSILILIIFIYTMFLFRCNKEITAKDNELKNNNSTHKANMEYSCKTFVISHISENNSEEKIMYDISENSLLYIYHNNVSLPENFEEINIEAVSINKTLYIYEKLSKNDQFPESSEYKCYKIGYKIFNIPDYIDSIVFNTYNSKSIKFKISN